jgi:DNA (cytosine-5)-methyltransferase 1
MTLSRSPDHGDTAPLRFAELFAGAGGLSMGLERAGWVCAWHAEIADAPRAILAHRWPDVPLYGDVTTLDGKALTVTHGAIDLLTGGSPCQDLSVAGKRAGLGGNRSSFFFQQMRLWDESGADLCLWENVDGARSSNEGKDFGSA